MPTMPRNDLAADKQTQPQSSFIRLFRCGGWVLLRILAALIEPLEDVGEPVLWNATAVVAHHQQQFSSVRARWTVQRGHQRLLRRRGFDRIRDEIRQHLADTV